MSLVHVYHQRTNDTENAHLTSSLCICKISFFDQSGQENFNMAFYKHRLDLVDMNFCMSTLYEIDQYVRFKHIDILI